MTGKVFSINISSEKGGPKHMVKAGSLRENFGLVGDAHAGSEERQISLLAIEEIEKVESAHPASSIDFHPGIFAENITTEGIDLSHLNVGDKLLIGGKVVLKIVQIGKECHDPCRIGQEIGQCLMPKRGIFARVEQGGEIRVRDTIQFLRQRSFLWMKR